MGGLKTAAARCWRKAAQGKIRVKPQQLFFVQKETSGKTINMNVRKSENGVKRTREHKEFPAGNDSGLSDLDGMERLCCCRKETFCFRQLPQQQV